jgi:hypothetical protein
MNPMIVINKVFNFFVRYFGRHYYYSTITQIVEVDYNGYDYNLSIDKDETYLANGFLVHNCRSTTVAVFRGETHEVDGVERLNLTNGTRSSKGDEGGQQVNVSNTYNSWLGKQSKTFQVDALGRSRAELFRKGGLTVDKFVDRLDKPLTLEELKATYPTAWEKANLGT